MNKAVSNQQGAALIVSLVFLVVLTTLGLAAMEGSSFEAKLAQSVQTQMDAFNNAEAALISGEKFVCTQQKNTATCNGGFTKNFDNDAQGTSDKKFIGKTVSASSAAALKSNFLPSGENYTVEYLGTITPSGSSVNLGGGGSDKRYLFRVTGYGAGERGGTIITQSYYTTTD